MSKEKHSIEELLLMVNSAEKVTDRRLGNNKTNYSICIAILVAIAIIWKWSLTNGDYFFGGSIMVLIVSFIAVIFSTLWINQITDFKLLNGAKFDVINEMSKSLVFDSQDKDVNIVSYSPYQKEWEKLEKLKALQTKNNIVTLKSTNVEYFLPKALRVIFAIIFLVSLLIIALNPIDTWESIKTFIHIN